VSRIRQIKPSWFLDKELRRGTSAEAREFYVGLWMLADDEGYLAWDVERVAAELYPYDATARRERNVVKWAEQLMALNPGNPHLVVYDCGHASVPKMKQHQRVAGTRSEGTRNAHRERCRDVRRRASLQVATASHGRELVEERNVEVGTVGTPERAPEGATGGSEFQRLVPRDRALGRVPA
jgi:hypothetical protein